MTIKSNPSNLTGLVGSAPRILAAAVAMTATFGTAPVAQAIPAGIRLNATAQDLDFNASEALREARRAQRHGLLISPRLVRRLERFNRISQRIRFGVQTDTSPDHRHLDRDIRRARLMARRIRQSLNGSPQAPFRLKAAWQQANRSLRRLNRMEDRFDPYGDGSRYGIVSRRRGPTYILRRF